MHLTKRTAFASPLFVLAARSAFAAGALAALAPAHALTAAQCAALSSLSVPATTITSAALVAASATAPEYCRVQGRVDAEIAFDLGLPSHWNGKFYHQGGGGFVGSIPSIAAGLARGYASIATNTGHTGAGVAALDAERVRQLTPLERWVEQGVAPGPVVATKYKDNAVANGVERTRPLCEYPKMARHLGGSINDAANFECRHAPRHGQDGDDHDDDEDEDEDDHED